MKLKLERKQKGRLRHRIFLASNDHRRQHRLNRDSTEVTPRDKGKQ